MDTTDKEIYKKVCVDKAQLVLLETQQLASLNVKKFQDINLDLYEKVIISKDVASSEEYIKQVLSLAVPTKIFIIQRLITIDRKNRVLKLYFNGKSQFYFLQCKAKNPEQFEKMEIIFKTSANNSINKCNLKYYVQQFPNLKLLTLNLTASNQLYKEVIDDRIEFLNDYKFIENIDMLLNDVKIIKRKDNIKVEQIISSQKKLNITFKNENNIKVIQKLGKVIDLTNLENIKQIQEIIEEYSSSPDFINIPHAIKLFDKNISIREATQIVQKFPNINKVHIFSLKDKTDDDKQEFSENMKVFIQSIQKLSKITFQQEEEFDFIEKHSNIISICKDKFKDFKVTWLIQQFKIIKYDPIQKYLRIINMIDFSQNKKQSKTEEEFHQIFKLYPDVQKIFIKSDQDTVQSAINKLYLMDNLKIVIIFSMIKVDSFDFQPIYHMNFQELSFKSQDQYGFQYDAQLPKSFESLLNHPNSILITSYQFRFDTQIKSVNLNISHFNQCELFANLILTKYCEMEEIVVKYNNFIYGNYFFSKILTAPCLKNIKITNFGDQKDQKQLEQMFKVIQVQKLQIIAIEKHIKEYSPIYLPSLIFDLFS